jgi:hypothetical protein
MDIKTWTGKAVHLLKDNTHAELIIDRVQQNEAEVKKLQLYYAVRTDSWQC